MNGRVYDPALGRFLSADPTVQYPTELQSYNRFMREHLFDHIDIDLKNAHVPDGTVARDKVWQFCQQYEKQIKEAAHR